MPPARHQEPCPGPLLFQVLHSQKARTWGLELSLMNIAFYHFLQTFAMPFGHHTLLLSLEGGLSAFGYNTTGQLGLGHTDNQWKPVEVPWNGPQPVQVDWGDFHSIVLDAEGGVWETGCSRSFTPSLTFQRAPDLPLIAFVASGVSHSAAIDTEGGLWEIGRASCRERV